MLSGCSEALSGMIGEGLFLIFHRKGTQDCRGLQQERQECWSGTSILKAAYLRCNFLEKPLIFCLKHAATNLNIPNNLTTKFRNLNSRKEMLAYQVNQW